MIRRLAKLSVLAGVAALALPGAANAGVLTETAKGCTDPALGQHFLPWADVMNYTAAPGGTAESTDGWNLSDGAGIGSGNEPWNIAEDGGTKSLRLPAGSSATTDTMCVGIEYPTLRFFAKSQNAGLLSSLRVDVTVETWLGATVTLPVAVVLPSGQWKVTPPYLVAGNLLPLLPGDRTPVRFTFTPQGSGTWSVDDVFVDPYRGG